jgi:hypothetical protein
MSFGELLYFSEWKREINCTSSYPTTQRCWHAMYSWVPDTRLLPDGYGHGYEILPVGMIMGGDESRSWILSRAGICFTRPVPDPLPSIPMDHLYDLNFSSQPVWVRSCLRSHHSGVLSIGTWRRVFIFSSRNRVLICPECTHSTWFSVLVYQ